MKVWTTVFPLRVSMKRKEPWELLVEVENEDDELKKVSLRVELPREATFSTVGLSNTYEKRFESFKPKQKFSVKLPVYQSSVAMDGSYSGRVRVAEHFHDFDYVERSFSKAIPLRIVAD